MKHFKSEKSTLNPCTYGRVRRLLTLLSTTAMLAGILAVSIVVLAGGPICWTGNGTTNGELNNVICNTDTPPGTMLWIFTTGGSTGNTVSAATLTVNGDVYQGVKKGTQFHFYTTFYAPDPNLTSACVTYVGTAGSGAKVLTISHGCPPFVQGTLWCSPGFWRNALDPAWALTGYTRTDLYNGTPCGTSNPVSGTPTLQDVLNNPNVYGGAAFNCVGQLLTNTLCGGNQLNPNCPNADKTICPDNCPIDHAGDVKDDAICVP